MKRIELDVKQQALIYVVQNKLNGKKYIGYTSNTLEYVMQAHASKYNKSYAGSSKLFEAMRKDGIINFIYRELSIVTYTDRDDLLKAVERAKRINDTINNGYN